MLNNIKRLSDDLLASTAGGIEADVNLVKLPAGWDIICDDPKTMAIMHDTLHPLDNFVPPATITQFIPSHKVKADIYYPEDN